MDLGTTTGTNGHGCDNCTVSWSVKITWNHTGVGSWVVHGTVFDDEDVYPGDTQIVTSSEAISMDCNTTKTVSATNNIGGQSTITVTCNKCQ